MIIDTTIYRYGCFVGDPSKINVVHTYEKHMELRHLSMGSHTEHMWMRTLCMKQRTLDEIPIERFLERHKSLEHIKIGQKKWIVFYRRDGIEKVNKIVDLNPSLLVEI